MRFVDDTEHLAVLSERVQKIVRTLKWRHVYGVELLKFGLKLLGFIGSFWVFNHSHFLFRLVGMICMAYFFVSIAISGIHEARHGTFAHSNIANRIWGYFFSDFWTGQSNEWWHDTHVLIHHPNTNIPTINPPSFYFPWINRYAYFFIVPYLILPWIIIGSIKHIWKNGLKLALYMVFLISGLLAQFVLFLQAVPFWYAILSVYLFRSLFAPLFMHLAVFNHVGLATPEKRLPWLRHQLKTTRNIKKNWFLSGMGGNAFVECHTEHHIFPNLSNHILKKIRPIVKEYVEKLGYPYYEETYFEVLKGALRDYDKVFTFPPPTPKVA